MADPYTNLDNIKKAHPIKRLVELTDEGNTGEIDQLVIDDVIDTADKKIDGVLRGRYPVELESGSIPELITDISTAISIYYLYKRKLYTTLPEVVVNEYKDAMKMLMKIQEGKISPWPSTNEPAVVVSNKTSASKIYNSTLWGTY